MIIQPPSTLLIGPPGAGKTDALATAIEGGLELFVVVTEPGGEESLIDSVTRRGLPVDKLHWATARPAIAAFSALDDMANKIGSMSVQSLAEIKEGIGKSETRKAALALLEQLKNFKDERTGQSFGDYSLWDDKRMLAIDSLSGVSLMAMALTIGFKPTAHPGEWGVAMNFIEQLLLKVSGDRKCFLTVTAHAEKEMNEVSGQMQVMASTLGKKLAPKIPRFFSEVVLAKRSQTKFTWSTMDNSADLKNRGLEAKAELEPSFVPLVKAYRKRLETAGAPATTPPSPPAQTVPQLEKK